MAADNYRKIKLLKLMELLRQDTDEQHPIPCDKPVKRRLNLSVGIREK